jgi:hypothetical protein
MSNLLFALESFRRHMDNGRWLFQLGMERQGYVSVGKDMPSPGVDATDVEWAVKRFSPRIVIFWPRYEWDSREWVGPEVKPEHCYRNWEYLLTRPDILRVCVFHDAGSARDQQRRWHEAFKPHVYLTWYHADSVLPFAPHIQRGQLVRTYHILDSDNLPPFEQRAKTCIVSGAYTPDVYPLRTRVFQWANEGKLGLGVEAIKHPGYKQAGTHSNEYAKTLAQYKVAVCTASAYRFALRKIVEATAAGCRVVTNLPSYDLIPGIDDNLIRVPSDIGAAELREIIQGAAATWNFNQQQAFADAAVRYYDWRVECQRVAKDLEMRVEAM